MSRRRTSRLEGDSETGVVAGLGQEGQGILHGGKTAFVAGALPGETIRFRRARRHRHYDEGRLEQILAHAPERVSPRCAHFDTCGGCALQHLDSTAQLQLKQQQLAESLRRLARLEPAPPLDQ